MKKLFLSIFAVAAIAVSSVSCGPRLVILHTNDTHSHLEAVRGGDRDALGGIIERAAIVDSIRHRFGRNHVLLLHAGDFNQGTSYYTTFGGELEVEMVRALGYDCITLGNHEFDNGLEDLAARLKKLPCPVVCANIDVSSLPLDSLVVPCTVIRRGGMRIGIVGVTADLTSCVASTISSRIPLLDNAEVINRWAASLKEESRCDMVILLSHLGYDEDQEIVSRIRNVDLVIGGHSHTPVDDFVYVDDLDGKKVPIATAWCWGMNMGKVEIR